MASFDDVDIFEPPTPLSLGSLENRFGGTLGYGLEPMEPTPAMQRRDTVAKYLQKIGYNPRRSYQMAEKMVGTGELIGEFLPGASMKLAQERDDVWGERLSYLDLIPGAPLATVPIKKAVKESVKRKGIASLDQTKKMIEADVDKYARSYKWGDDYDKPQPQVSPTIKALIEKAPPNLKGEQITQWLHGNYKKGVKPQELEHLGLDEFIAQNPNATMREAIQHASDNKVLIQKRYRRGDDAPTIEFEKSTPDTDPLDGSNLWEHKIDDIRHDLDSGDEYMIDNVLDRFNYAWMGPSADEVTKFKNIAELDDYISGKYVAGYGIRKKPLVVKGEEISSMDDVVEFTAKSEYYDNPYELIEPVSVGGIDANIGRKTFAFGNDEAGYSLFVDGNRVTNTDNVAYSRTEAELQLRDKMQEGGDPLRMEGEEVWDETYKSYVDASLPGGSNYREVVFAWDEAPKTHNITTHFPDEDAIASALIRDRKLADGKNSLHVDELQSDLHTAGSKSGYRLPDVEFNKIKKEIDPLLEGTSFTFLRHTADDQAGLAFPIKGNTDGFLDLQKFDTLATKSNVDPSIKYDGGRSQKLLFELGSEKKFDEFVETVRPLIKEGAVPNYPFKEDYHVMGLKQLLLDAVSEGKDALSVSGSFPIKQRYSDKYAVFYETLYDKKIPSAMKKLANKYGGKFEKGKLDLDDIYKPQPGDVRLDPHGTGGEKFDSNIIHITPEMKEKILKEGVELFGKGGRVGGTLDEPLEGNTREIL